MAEERNNDDLTTSDGRKIVSFSSAGEAYTVESTNQAAQGKKAELEFELMKRRAGFNPLKLWQGNDRSARR
ncbi:MAG: hypothetical protein IJL92_08720 [Thermoguttaceae bacterium]|nr:hypothetical protein [Thermoguttaceae bacterium]